MLNRAAGRVARIHKRVEKIIGNKVPRPKNKKRTGGMTRLLRYSAAQKVKGMRKKYGAENFRHFRHFD